jgi:chitin-binding protein
VYYGTGSHSYSQAYGSGVSTGQVTAYTVSGLTSGTLYYFSITAIDAAGDESTYSNEVSAIAP